MSEKHRCKPTASCRSTPSAWSAAYVLSPSFPGFTATTLTPQPAAASKKPKVTHRLLTIFACAGAGGRRMPFVRQESLCLLAGCTVPMLVVVIAVLHTGRSSANHCAPFVTTYYGGMREGNAAVCNAHTLWSCRVTEHGNLNCGRAHERMGTGKLMCRVAFRKALLVAARLP
jgi:hypothetical protein